MLIVWRGAYELNLAAALSRSIVLLLTIFLIICIGITYYDVAGKDAGTSLLLGLLCLKLHEIKGYRDISVISNIALFSIVINFLYDQSILVAIVMLFSLVFIFCALIGYGHSHNAHRSEQQNLRSLIQSNERMHFTLASKMLLQALPLALVLFIFFPRIDGPLWGLAENSYSASTGLTETMSPGRISQLSDNDAIAFRVKFDENTPNADELYWRGPVMWHFDGYNWTAPEASESRSQGFEYRATDKIARYTITLKPHHRYWLFALDLPVEIPKGSFLSSEMQVLSRSKVKTMRRYQLASLTSYKIPGAQDGISRYLQLPEESSPRSRQLMNKLAVPSDPESTITAVLAYFSSNGFYYSRNAPLLLEQPVDEFLFDTKRGYCEHFASTFTVMMRLAGLPSRVVTGYLGGQVNPIDNIMAVRQSDAHAWSEVYLGADKGWVRVDPTAYIPASNIENLEDALRLSLNQLEASSGLRSSWFTRSYRQISYAWDVVNNQWNQWVLDYDIRRQRALFATLGFPEITWKGLAQGLFIAFLAFTGGLATRIFAMPTRHQNTVQDYYARFLRRFQKFGIHKGVSEGASDFCQRLSTAFPERASEIIEISRLYNQLRYGKEGNEAVFQRKIKSFRI